MHVQSTLNHSNRLEDVPVAVFRYYNKRKFLTKEKEYETALNTVRKAFEIETSVTLYTSTLDVCREKFVEIDSSAYSALRPVLDEILVFEAGNDPEEASANRGKQKTRMSTTMSATSSAYSVARHLQPHASAASSSGRTVQAPRGSAVQPHPQRTSAVHETVIRKGSTGSLDVKDYHSASEAENEQEMQENDHENVLGEDRQPRRSEAAAANTAPEPDEEEEEGEPPGYDENELFDDAAEGPGVTYEEPAHSEEQNRRTSEEFDMVPERSYRTGISRAVESPPPSPSPSPEKPSSRSQQLANELFPESPSPAPRPKFKPRTDEPKYTPVVKPEPPVPSKKATASSTAVPSRASAKPKIANATAPCDPDSRIAIVIQVVTGDEDGPSATFKMRGRHMVQKILKTACQNFGLDAKRASLLLCQDIYDAEGICVDTEYLLCPNDKTASQCGVTDGARLLIESEADTDSD